MIVLISDLLIDRDVLFRGLEMLTQRRHDILVFHVLDEDEMVFPFTGTTRFEGMEELPHLLCDPAPARRLPRSAARVPDRGRRGCTRIGIDYHLVRTSDYLDAVLTKFLHHRMDDRVLPAATRRAGRSNERMKDEG